MWGLEEGEDIAQTFDGVRGLRNQRAHSCSSVWETLAPSPRRSVWSTVNGLCRGHRGWWLDFRLTMHCVVTRFIRQYMVATHMTDAGHCLHSVAPRCAGQAMARPDLYASLVRFAIAGFAKASAPSSDVELDACAGV